MFICICIYVNVYTYPPALVQVLLCIVNTVRAGAFAWAELPNIIRVGLENDGKLHTNLGDDQEVHAPPSALLPLFARKRLLCWNVQDEENGRGLTDLDGDLTGLKACRRMRLSGLTGVVLCWDVQDEEKLAHVGANQTRSCDLMGLGRSLADLGGDLTGLEGCGFDWFSVV